MPSYLSMTTAGVWLAILADWSCLQLVAFDSWRARERWRGDGRCDKTSTRPGVGLGWERTAAKCGTAWSSGTGVPRYHDYVTQPEMTACRDREPRAVVTSTANGLLVASRDWPYPCPSSPEM